MAKKSVPTEELLRLVKELPAVKKTSATTEIESFARDLGIKPGIYEIPNQMIFTLYKIWSEQFPAKKVMDFRAFFRKFGENFERKVTNFNKWYYCNLEPFNLTVEQHSKMYREMKDAENKKTNEIIKRGKERKKEIEAWEKRQEEKDKAEKNGQETD